MSLLDNRMDSQLAAAICIELASALRLVGRNQEAVSVFDRVIDANVHATVRVRALEEKAHLLRIMQDLPAATIALDLAKRVRFEEQLTVSDGVGLYYSANIYRDRREFSRAEPLYERALIELTEVGDNYQECCLHGDVAWMKFLDGDIPTATLHLDDAGRIAAAFGFGREMSEHEHIRYHCLVEQNEYPKAYDALDRALTLARDYSNISMQLDCLMHCVQRAVRVGRLDQTFEVIDEMKEIEDKGSGMIVFRGRALIYQGDGLLERGEEGAAYNAWRMGLELVARHGHSRSSVDLLDNLIDQRKERFQALQRNLRETAWPDAAALRELPSLSALAEALGRPV